MGRALERLIRDSNTGLSFQMLMSVDTSVWGDVVMGEAGVIARLMSEGKISARDVTTLVMRDADRDCVAVYGSLGRQIFQQLKQAGAKFLGHLG
eukprot:COSAG06_NODE_15073_length_1099_cov_1.926000_3_plen_94_part_00